MKRMNNMVPIAPAANTVCSQQTDDPYRKKRTRAKRSCDHCRKRKTKCDADVRQPCTKCTHANVTCEFLVEQKKRGPSSGGYIELLENRLLRMEKLIKNMEKGKGMDHEGEDGEEEESGDDFIRNHPSSSSSFSSPPRYEEDEIDVAPIIKCKALLASLAEKDYENIDQQMDKLTISDYQRTRYIGASSGVQFLEDGFLRANVKHPLPDEPSWFVQKLNEEEDEHVFMKSKEVLLPSESKEEFQSNRIEIFEDTPYITQEIADYIVHLYFTRIHIYCPIINKTQFLEQYYFHNPTPPDKYLLFAITCVGTTIFSPEILNIQSFDLTPEQLEEMGSYLKEKAHQILNIVYKRPMISTVQSLMILSMFVSHDTDEEDTAHWLITGMAIRMAQDLGLHRDCSKWKIPDYEIELRKRLWYAAYLMDRWVAAELGRPVSIIDHEFDVELPTPYELNSPSKHRDITPILILEAESSLKQKIPVYSGFIYLITLSQIAGQVLVGFHSTRGKHNRENNQDLLKILESNLTNWKLSLPKELRLDLTVSRTDIFYAQACVVNMACDCVWILLYRSFIKHNKDQPENMGLAVKALSICTACAVNLIDIVEAVEYHAFVSLPWNMAVYAVFQAAIIFLHNAKGENAFLREQGKRNLIRCSRVYDEDPYLRKTRVVHVLLHVVSNFEVNMNSPSTITVCSRKRTNQRSDNSDYSNTSKYSYDVTSPNMELDTVDGQNDQSATQSSSYQNSGLPDNHLQEKKRLAQQEQHQHFCQQQQLIQQQFLQHKQQLNHTPAVNGPFYDCNILPQEATQFDLASLSSEIPLWDVPSGATWNEWESFLKSNVDNQKQ
ncbi:fungal-specific transcription factor domain-containing protein [Mucor mucedo]|uniref:fungal-specific transcription factor domain-containing protein n=1 Tax=Mucor mucedo TaxID=29922 RepID=UPI00221E840D|nr:fungal-specific transcription factor domain-containing protein [Mucor mucedo]KAI7876653.1 fungal-specific transcription factor domain-containing protein [Mucor mucedo]